MGGARTPHGSVQCARKELKQKVRDMYIVHGVDIHATGNETFYAKTTALGDTMCNQALCLSSCLSCFQRSRPQQGPATSLKSPAFARPQSSLRARHALAEGSCALLRSLVLNLRVGFRA